MKKFLLPMVLLLSGWTGIVTEVRDGNVMTIHNMETGRPELVRLWACDAPEIDQPYGQESHDFLEKLVMDQEVEVTVKSQDWRGKTVAEIRQGDVDVNNAMVEGGCVWLDGALRGIDVLLASFEVACAEGRGLWANKDAIHPRAWCKINRRSGRSLDAVTVAKSLDSLSRMDPELLLGPVKSKSASDLSVTNKVNHS